MRTAVLSIGGLVGAFVIAIFALAVIPAMLLEGDKDRTDWGPSVVAYSEIPEPILNAYIDASRSCAGLPWQIVAAIGFIESGHGTYGGSIVNLTTGDVTPPIIGIPLDGTNNTQAVPDTDDGVLDGDPVWDRAVGPMQFIPATWHAYGVHGDGRMVATPPDPQNIYDAINTAVNYLCEGHDQLNRSVDAAIKRYNNSGDYVRAVKAKALDYGMGQDGRDDAASSIDGEVIQGDASLAVTYALSQAQTHKPYVWGHPLSSDLDDPDPDGFDCSGLVVWSYRRLGLKLPHFTDALIKLGRNIDTTKEGIEPGDLIFTRGGIPVRDGGHVGIAISETKYVVAANRRVGVVVRDMPTRIVAIRRLVVEKPDSVEYDAASTGDGTPPTDPDTRKVTDRNGYRWDLGHVYTEPVQTRGDAIDYAHTYDRLVAAPPAFRAHMLRMRQTNKKFEVLYWTSPNSGEPWDITTPEAPAMVADLCLHGIQASGYGGCMLNLPLASIRPCPSDNPTTITTTTLAVPPTTVAGTPTTATPDPPDCITKTRWEEALGQIAEAVKGNGDSDESDGDLLVVINGRNTYNRIVIKAPEDNNTYQTDNAQHRQPDPVNHAFPVDHGTYSQTHHDYPAADIFAPCNTPAYAPVDGIIDHVERTDHYVPQIDDPETKGGLAVAINGEDGVRYYLSHLSTIDHDTVIGRRVKAGDKIANVGDTGNAKDTGCHIHFGISPRCPNTEYWIRRGILYPQPWLARWQTGDTLATPQKQIQAWDRDHPAACHTRPTGY